jgi:transposase
MYKHYDNEQKIFVVLDEDSNFPKGSFTRFLNDFVEEQVDTEPFELKRRNVNGGAPAKHVKLMLKVIFYAFSQGIYSMRELAKYLSENINFIYLSAYQSVNHSTLSRFINHYKEEIQDVFASILYVSSNMGYVTSKLVAIDGCRIKANASRNFTGNYTIFEKRKKTFKKMIANLLERSIRLEENESIVNKDKERRKIERLKKTYENSLNKIDAFLKGCNDVKKKSI